MKDGSRRFAGISDLSRALERATKPAFAKRGFAEQRIITDWPQIVGEVIARYSTPLKLVFPPEKRSDGVLHIEVYDSALATEIHYIGPMVLERIATYFGYRAVASLKLTQKPMPWQEETEREEKEPTPDSQQSEAIQKMVEDIADEALRERLLALGCRVVVENMKNK